jgi:hypothetical protein
VTDDNDPRVAAVARGVLHERPDDGVNYLASMRVALTKID